MKKRNISSLTLNKRKVSQLQVEKGGYAAPTAQCTMSTCSCVTCRPDCTIGQSRFICPPRPTEECTFITCPPPTTGFEIP